MDTIQELQLPYLEEYKDFIMNYKSGQVNGEQVGEVIARLAQYFSEFNNRLVNAERALFIVAKDIEMREDERTGKPITSTKATVIVSATDEHYIVEILKAHVENIEQFINALKALQKGVLNEHSYAGL
jgi:hypothetical protein